MDDEGKPESKEGQASSSPPDRGLLRDRSKASYVSAPSTTSATNGSSNSACLGSGRISECVSQTTNSSNASSSHYAQRTTRSSVLASTGRPLKVIFS